MREDIIISKEYLWIIFQGCIKGGDLNPSNGLITIMVKK